jgi:hypothetical protein
MEKLLRLLEDRRVHYVILVGWILLIIRRTIIYFPVNFDDAWMFIRYAQNMLRGYSYTWNAGEGPVYGCTSVAYTLWITGLKGALGQWLSDGMLLLISSLGFLLLATVVILEGSYQLVKKRLKYSRSFVYALLLLVLTNAGWIYHGNTGMETSMSMLINALFFWQLLRLGEAKHKLQHWLLFLLLGYLSFLIRPEHAPFFLLMPLLLLPISYGWNGRETSWLLALIVLILAVDTVAKFAYFGSPLPLPYFVKKLGFYEGATVWYHNPARQMSMFVLFTLPLVVAGILMFEGKRHWGMVLGVGLPTAICLAALLDTIQVMGEEMRYYAPLVPHFVLCLAWLVAHAEYPFPQKLRPGRFLLAMAYCTIAIGIMPFVEAKWLARLQSYIAKNAVAAVEVDDADFESLNDLAEQLAQEINRLPSGVSITGTEHGRLSALLPAHRLLDLTGLHNPYVSSGAEIVPWVVSQRPEIIWMPHTGCTVMHKRLRNAPLLRRDYIYHPQAFRFGLAIRKDIIPLLRERGAFLDYLPAESSP